jgi:hypothetical protein
MQQKENRIENLINIFADCVVKQHDAIWQKADSNIGNKYARKLIKAWDDICKMGDNAKDSFVILLYHDDVRVRSSAACFLLKYKHEEAKRVLIEISKGEDITAFEASQCLMRWKEGEWHLDE